MLIHSAPLKHVAASLRSGQRDLLGYIVESCNRLDSINPQIQAFLPEPGRRDRLRREALDLTAQFPIDRPPLYGVLVGVKDIFRADGLETRAGSALPPELFAGPESSVVTLLKANGALVMGKTVTTEFAYFEPGPTRNPHNLDHTPGGSSSGSASAVAAGLVPLALGTQTIGSIIRPAAYCGIVGYKPSYGRIATDGVIAISQSLDHVGLFAQDVDGVSLVASLLCKDWQPAAPDRLPVLGVPQGAYLAQAETLDPFEAYLERFVKTGLHVVRVPELDDIETIAGHNRQLMSAEMAEVHREWFATYESRYRPRTAGLIREGQTVTREALAAAHTAQAELRARLERTMHDAGIDLWVCPAALGPAPHGVDSTGSPAMNLPWTFCGLPVVSVPAGIHSTGLPLGVQFVGRYYSDERLLSWAISLVDLLARDP